VSSTVKDRTDLLSEPEIQRLIEKILAKAKLMKEAILQNIYVEETNLGSTKLRWVIHTIAYEYSFITMGNGLFIRFVYPNLTTKAGSKKRFFNLMKPVHDQIIESICQQCHLEVRLSKVMQFEGVHFYGIRLMNVGLDVFSDETLESDIPEFCRKDNALIPVEA